ncbi:hypothetical protein LJ739_04870 [Aestuariibacter halophilus]|uniref:Lipoprotein n=1 Tax=Fluctibacter halophilus TaxID=226011 RepID=A0ABS8G4W3_9ALTE|nr:hypothetical protein [Aestuariibacter halophilus]MCC2615568.1 hypothetical protein [Aestuariibacter halophilus]
MRTAVIVTLMVLALSGCGGSSSSPSTVTPPPVQAPGSYTTVTPAATLDAVLIYAPDEVLVGQSIGLAISARNGGRLNNLQWQQISGPAQVPLLADRSPVVGFDIPAAGDYVFAVSGRNNGQSFSHDISFSAQETSNRQANIRLDHSASEQAKVSLRVDIPEGLTPTSIEWEQTAGPQVSNTRLDDDNQALYYDNPAVDEDVLVEWLVTVVLDDQQTLTDTAWVLARNVNIDLQNGFFPRYSQQIVTEDIQAYRQDSPYFIALQDCIYTNTLARSCDFSRLPLLGQEHSDVSIDDIMDRVLVSHRWMGQEFEAYLQQTSAQQDLLQLFGATTAIVISYDVRPSFYWSATGAIYLDANNLWRTPQQRDTLNDQPDFRSDFGDDLQFIIPWRYVKNGQYYFRSSDFPPELRLSRTQGQQEASMTWLLYHELAHANDFLPPDAWATLPSDVSPLAYSDDNPPRSASFVSQYPLRSATMKSLAQVRYAGETASTVQRNYQPGDIVGFFTPDDATSFYSYSTDREDYATVFERFMMAYRMGVEADVGILASQDNDDLLVTWGQRNRIAKADLLGRTRYVVNQILPDIDVDAAYAVLAAPQLLNEGVGWLENLDLTATGKRRSAQPRKVDMSKAAQGTLWHQHYHLKRKRPVQH